MSVVNLGEVHYILLKYIGERAAQEHLQALQHAVTMVGVDQASALEAASLKHAYKIGHVDSFAAALALRLKATLVSADPIFEKLGMSLKWIKLPPFVPNAEGRPRNR
jgi:predicted nucleic acid-binding protein